MSAVRLPLVSLRNDPLLSRFFRAALLLSFSFALSHPAPAAQPTNRTNRFPINWATNDLGFRTNKASVYQVFEAYRPRPIATFPGAPTTFTNEVFSHYIPGSLNAKILADFLTHTNGRSTRIWTVRSHPPGWPKEPPTVRWNTNSLLYPYRGMTALSPCWELEGLPGQVPITALTRRHGYTRGHSTGPNGFHTKYEGRKVWFLTRANQCVEVRVTRGVTRTLDAGVMRDYTLVLFDRDLPAEIRPLRVVSGTNLVARYPQTYGAPHPVLATEQSGGVSAGVFSFQLNTWKPGDSGSPNLLPYENELVFFGGRSTSGPSAEMQADMDELCHQEKLDPRRYQMDWLDLADYPVY